MRLVATIQHDIEVDEDDNSRCSQDCQHLDCCDSYCFLFDENLDWSWGEETTRCFKCKTMANPPAEAVADCACGKGF